MSNSLTGDFDIVAEFAVSAVNRLLAAMHRTGRFPHSLTVRVDDHVKPDIGGLQQPVLVAAMDLQGDPITNHQHIGQPASVLGGNASANYEFLNLNPVVNVGDLVFTEDPIVPSNLQGRAQLQVFPPKIEVPDNTGKNIRVKMETIARYFPDPNTSALAEFVRGEMKITASVTQVASQVANVVEIDVKASSVGIDFTPSWSSRALAAEDLAGINLMVRNAFKTSFLPSSSTLPSDVSHVQFKTMNGPQPAVAVLLDKSGGPGNRASATNIFTGGSDFAFGVSAEFVKGALQPTLDKMLANPIDPIHFKIDSWVHTWTITYLFTLTSAVVELENGAIVITMTGHAHTSSWTPDFDFTVRAPFTLEAAGDTANLVAGDVSFDTSSWIIDRFKGAAISSVERVRDRSLTQSGAQDTVHDMLSANKNLGQFIKSLLTPPQHGDSPPLSPLQFWLGYSVIEITPSGIVLRGSLTVASWPSAHVEFEQIPANGGDRAGIDATSVSSGPDYTALKSWIPGGTVSRYEWKSFGQTQPGFSDQNKFVLLHQPLVSTAAFANAPVALAGYTPMCLTVHGTRITSAGPVAMQSVEATVCGIHTFPVGGTFEVSDYGSLTIAMVQPGTNGLVEVSGHTAALAAEKGRNAPNMIVHFGDHTSASGLAAASQALRESGRSDAATAIFAVLSADDIPKTKFVSGVTYADDRDGAWSKRYGVGASQKPITLIVSPEGKVVGRQEGRVDAGKLAEALRKSLVAVGDIKARMKASAIRIGHRPPNFLFEYAPGREVTLQKIEGRQVAIVFWRSNSKESIEQVRRLDKIASGKSQLLVLAVNDGESADVAKRVAVEQKLRATVVVDSARQIGIAYGVGAWPTTVWIDELGAARAIRIGDFGGDPSKSPLDETPQDSAGETIEQRGTKS